MDEEEDEEDRDLPFWVFFGGIVLVALLGFVAARLWGFHL
jgi:hypothetical protein